MTFGDILMVCGETLKLMYPREFINKELDVEVAYVWGDYVNERMDIEKIQESISNHDYERFMEWYNEFKEELGEDLEKCFPPYALICSPKVGLDIGFVDNVLGSEKAFALISKQFVICIEKDKELNSYSLFE